MALMIGQLSQHDMDLTAEPVSFFTVKHFEMHALESAADSVSEAAKVMLSMAAICDRSAPRSYIPTNNCRTSQAVIK